jgi:hypothetical protein
MAWKLEQNGLVEAVSVIMTKGEEESDRYWE